jgi:periplasmic divalent cation tolerance protein
MDRIAHGRALLYLAGQAKEVRERPQVSKSKERKTPAKRGDTGKVVVVVSCGTASEADRIARAVVGSRLAACVNVIESGVRSTYRWKEKVESAQEYLLLIKTARELVPALRWQIEKLHSYELPEIIALPIVDGSPSYLAWLEECVRPPEEPREK